MGRTDDELRQRRDELQKRDLAQRAQLAAYGVDPSTRRRIDLTFWAPDEDTARRLADAMTGNEMSPPLVLGPKPDGSGDRRWLLRTALDYDGWGPAVTEVAERERN